MLKRILKSLLSVAILSFFGNAALAMLKEGEYLDTAMFFIHGLGATIITYFTIEGKKARKN